MTAALSPVHVLIITPWASRHGGAEQMLAELAAHLDPERVVASFVFLEPGPEVAAFRALGHRVHVVEAGRLRHPPSVVRTVVRLARIYRTQRPDLVLNWMSKAQIFGGAAALLAGMRSRTLWWQHSVPDRHVLDRVATALPARVIGTSSRHAAAAQAKLRPSRPVFTIYPSAREADPAADVRDRLGVDERTTLIVTVARLQPWKGHHHVIRAIAVLRSRGRDVTALLVGGVVFGADPRYEDVLQELANDLGVSDRVVFVGHVADARPYSAAADIFVSASDVEPFGIALVEAMAAGTPCVAVDAAGPAEILGPSAAGILIARPDAALLAHAIEQLLDDPAEAARIGRAGREDYERRFTPDRMADGFMVQVERLARAD